MIRSAYAAALALLAGRDLTVREVRDRLAARGHEPAAVEEAVERLARERALDDDRVAVARARAGVARGRGRERVVRELEAAGIDRAAARAAADAAYGEVDEDDLLQRALERRLRRGSIRDRGHARRLYQALLRQGFPAFRIVSALKARGWDDA